LCIIQTILSLSEKHIWLSSIYWRNTTPRIKSAGVSLAEIATTWLTCTLASTNGLLQTPGRLQFQCVLTVVANTFSWSIRACQLFRSPLASLEGNLAHPQPTTKITLQEAFAPFSINVEAS